MVIAEVCSRTEDLSVAAIDLTQTVKTDIEAGFKFKYKPGLEYMWDHS